MKNSTSRRQFLQKTALATTGITLLSSEIANAMISEAPFEGYNPFAKATNDLRTNPFSKHLNVSGLVVDKHGQVIPNAIVESWHLSPGTNKFRHHAKFQADKHGRYQFKTDIPEKQHGKLRRIYFKVSDAHGTSNYSELVLNSSGASITSKHWEQNKHLGEAVLPQSKTLSNSTKITFNISNQTT